MNIEVLAGTKASDADIQAIKDKFHPVADGNNMFIKSYEVYSTDEVKIGEYLGKPLYRKLIHTGKFNSWDTTISVSNLGIVRMVDIIGFMYHAQQPSGELYTYIAHSEYIESNGDGVHIYYDHTNKNIVITYTHAQNWASITGYGDVFISYTKS